MANYDLTWRKLVLPLGVLWGLPLGASAVGALLDWARPERRRERERRLARASEVLRLFREPFLETDYRRPPLSYRACVRSLFALHNETQNVWTDVIATLFFVAWALRAGSGRGGGMRGASRSARLSFALSALSFALCKACSATAHLLGAHSVRANRFWFSLDFAGLCACVAGGAPATLSVAARSFPVPDAAYLALVGAASVRTFRAMTASHGSDEGKSSRLLAFGALLLLYKSPVAVRILRREMHHVGDGGGSASAALGVLSILLAGGAYGSKCPERCGGGSPVWLHSHMLWHLLANSALLFQHSFFARALTRKSDWRRRPLPPSWVCAYAAVMAVLMGRELREMVRWYRDSSDGVSCDGRGEGEGRAAL